MFISEYTEEIASFFHAHLMMRFSTQTNILLLLYAILLQDVDEHGSPHRSVFVIKCLLFALPPKPCSAKRFAQAHYVG